MAKSKRRRPRTAESVRRTADRKARRQGAQRDAERRNAEIRASGATPTSEELWGDLKARMAERRVTRSQERHESTWRRAVPPQRGQRPKFAGTAPAPTSAPWWTWVVRTVGQDVKSAQK
jgi:hypothetical protein